MKKFFYPLVLVILVALVPACNNNDNNVNPAGPVFTCKIDGTPWEVQNMFTVPMIRTEETTDIFFKTLSISGTAADGSILIAAFSNIQGAETGECIGEYMYYGVEHDDYETNAYFIDQGFVRYAEAITMSYSPTVTSTLIGIGNITGTITSCGDSKVSGTFQGILEGIDANGDDITAVITEGKFENISYIFQE